MSMRASMRRKRANLPGSELLEEDNLAAGVDGGARFEGRNDEVASGEPRVGVVVKTSDELVAH